MKGLTKRQREIVDFIEGFIETKKFSPSFREIKEYFGFSSLGTIYKHIQVLKRKGALQSEDKSSRSVALKPESVPQEKAEATTLEIPFVGEISANNWIETFAYSQTLTIPNFLAHSAEKTYILQVKGDFLLEEQIGHGDLLIVEARAEAEPGEMVVALINESNTIVKRYYPEGQFVRLEGLHEPILIKQDSLIVQGVLVGLLRMYAQVNSINT